MAAFLSALLVERVGLLSEIGLSVSIRPPSMPSCQTLMSMSAGWFCSPDGLNVSVPILIVTTWSL